MSDTLLALIAFIVGLIVGLLIAWYYWRQRIKDCEAQTYSLRAALQEKDKSLQVGLRYAIGILFTALSFLLILGNAVLFLGGFVPDILEIAIGLAIFLPMFSWWEILHAKVKK